MIPGELITDDGELELNAGRVTVAVTVSNTGDRPVQVGSRIEFVARFLGRRLAYTYEVRELEPGERLVMSTSEGPFPMETTYAWADSADGGTLMTLRNRGEPSGFTRVAAPMMARAMARANRADLQRLKEILEAR